MAYRKPLPFFPYQQERSYLKKPTTPREWLKAFKQGYILLNQSHLGNHTIAMLGLQELLGLAESIILDFERRDIHLTANGFTREITPDLRYAMNHLFDLVRWAGIPIGKDSIVFPKALAHKWQQGWHSFLICFYEEIEQIRVTSAE